jgi:hypothetical protein
LGTPGESAFRRAREVAPPGIPRVVARFLPQLVVQSSSWWKGGMGEEKVARRLSKLSRDQWMCLHDRPLGTSGRNVDHILIGPGGVFSINSKNLSGAVSVRGNAFYVNGYRDYTRVHAARNEGRVVSARLSAAVGKPVEVSPVIVVVAPSLDLVSQPDGVHVLGLRDVPEWFALRPSNPAAVSAAAVYEACRRAHVWTTPVEALRSQASQAEVVPGLALKRWCRGRQDRVYVNGPDRSSLGYLDRKTGEVHVEDPARKEDVMTMLAPYLAAPQGN